MINEKIPSKTHVVFHVFTDVNKKIKILLAKIPNPTPLQTALGIGTTLAGIYGGFTKPGDTDFGGFVSGGLNAQSLS